jgi:hypothetical protein
MPAGILYPYPWLSSLLHLQRRHIPSRHERPLLAKERTIQYILFLIFNFTVSCIMFVIFIYDYIAMYHIVCGTLFPVIILYRLWHVLFLVQLYSVKPMEWNKWWWWWNVLFFKLFFNGSFVVPLFLRWCWPSTQSPLLCCSAWTSLVFQLFLLCI